MRNQVYLIIPFLLLFVLSLFSPSLNTANADTYTPHVLSYYNTVQPYNATVEDDVCATINAGGNIVFQAVYYIGDVPSFISSIQLKDQFVSSNAKIDVYISMDNVVWYQIANNVYRSGSLNWRIYPISFDKKAFRYVKIINVGEDYAYYNIDDIHLDSSAYIFEKNGYHYPVKLMANSANILGCFSGNIGYSNKDIAPYVMYPDLLVNEANIDLDLDLRINATSVYLNHTRLSGSGNIVVYISSNFVSWISLGNSGGGNKNYTLTNPTEIKYVRLTLNGTDENVVYNIAVKGTIMNVNPLYVTPPDFYSYSFASVPILILSFVIGCPALIIYKISHTGTGALIGAFIGIAVGTYYSILPIWFMLIIVICLVVTFTMLRGRGGGDEA